MAVRPIVSGKVNPKSLKFNPSKHIEVMKETSYKVVLKSVETTRPMIKKSLFDRVKITFEFVNEEGMISQYFPLVPGESQLIGQLIFAITGKYEEADLIKLIGSEVGIQIKYKETDEYIVFPNIVSIFSVKE